MVRRERFLARWTPVLIDFPVDPTIWALRPKNYGKDSSDGPRVGMLLKELYSHLLPEWRAAIRKIELETKPFGCRGLARIWVDKECPLPSPDLLGHAYSLEDETYPWEQTVDLRQLLMPIIDDDEYSSQAGI